MNQFMLFILLMLSRAWMKFFHPIVFIFGRICGLFWYSLKAGFEPHDKNIENTFAVDTEEEFDFRAYVRSKKIGFEARGKHKR